MDLPIAFPQNSKFQNLKKFQSSPVLYMEEAVEQFGAPVDLNLPMGDFVVTNSPKHAHQILVTQQEKYQKSKGYREIARVLGNGLLTADGEQWHKQRKALQPSFHKTDLRKLLPAVWKTGEAFLKDQSDSSSLDLSEEMGRLTLNVLLNSLINYQDEQLKEKMIADVVFSQEFITNRIRSPFKVPVWVPTKQNRKYHKMMKEVNGLIKKCIQERQQLDQDKFNDILTVLMQNHDADAEFIKIRDELMTFFIAGHETSALGLAWGFHMLAWHPEVQQKLYDEVRVIQKLEDIDLVNFSNVRYLQLTVKEILRKYPPIWNIVRMAKEDDKLDGYTISKGKQVMMNIYLIHNNGEYWDSPDNFNPERFEELSLKDKLQYMPFGAGPRFCIGNNFAIFEMMILLLQLVRAFELIPLTQKDTGFNPLLTLRPDQPLMVKLKARDTVS
ncbi:cytochrome P450 [Fulvivirga sp. 29W222]|uniref:Cytochrome P450 n=1 Tax=Fulvivirga marina TaxID=2494733 RepID=A0A937FTR3_9BACT|nr:cytochrome P450 [Fulvivirga marina]MBL6445810.1 cytochrome P450 [Fulvivirga marina]